MEKRKDIYTNVTNRIIADLEKGVRPWLKPWDHGAARITRPLRHNGLPYRGINTINLWIAAHAAGYQCPSWLTYKQAQDLGGHVRKGEKSELVVFADSMKKKEINDHGDEVTYDIHFLKSYSVFNAQQIEGLPEHFYVKPASTPYQIQRIERAETFFQQTGAMIRNNGDRAFYAPSSDHIQMPPFAAFHDAESYYAVLAHEATHWTGHISRLDRKLDSRFGSQAYAAEELVAELGSAFLCADLQLTPAVRADHAAYISNWIEVLKGDKRAIFTAAAHAERSASFMHDLQAEARTKPRLIISSKIPAPGGMP